MTDDLQESFRTQMWGVQLSVRYHSRRQAFYQKWHTRTMLCTVLGGSVTIAAFATALGDNWPLWLKLLPSALGTVLGAVDAIFGLADKAADHKDLMRQFSALERELESIRHHPTQEAIERTIDERLRIEDDEPPVLHVLNAICHNELARAWGLGSQQVRIGYWQRQFANVFDLWEHSLP